MSDTTRRIAAVLFSDIVGFTAAMGRDEEAAIRVVEQSRAVQRELVARYHGEWLQEIGDGALCTFDSVVEAVTCAREIQQAFRGHEGAELRIGIHVGDLVFRKTPTGVDVFGDAVNIAARVQGVAESGGICVSERVVDDLRNHPEIRFRELGEKQLKNVNRPIRCYAVVGPDEAEPLPVPGRRRRLPWAWLGAGLALTAAAVAAVLLLDRAPSTPAEAPAQAEAEPAGEPAGAPPFEEVRRALLGAEGPWAEAEPRVWTDPDPVQNDAVYRIAFAAECNCAALLFAIDGSEDEITLVYPNPYEPERRLSPGEVIEIPSSPVYQLRAVGGQGMDILKLFVLREEVEFPGDPRTSWGATAESDEAVAELAALLERLEANDWATAATPLQIVR